MALIKKILLFLIISFSIIIGQTNNTVKPKTDSVFVMQKSPMGALLRSAVFPGWGQFYNESYWKIPVVWAATGWFTYMWIDRNNLYNKYQDLYNNSITGTSNGDQQLKRLRNFYRGNRDQFAVYFALTYLLNLVDAYVDAHLFDFDVGMNEITQKPELLIRLRL